MVSLKDRDHGKGYHDIGDTYHEGTGRNMAMWKWITEEGEGMENNRGYGRIVSSNTTHGNRQAQPQTDFGWCTNEPQRTPQITSTPVQLVNVGYPEPESLAKVERILTNILLSQADADFTDPNEAAELKRKRTFRKYQYRGIELDKLLDLSNQQFIEVRIPGIPITSWC
jgi:hypothetical protein